MSDIQSLCTEKENEKKLLEQKRINYENDIKNLDNKIKLLDAAKASINSDDNDFASYVKQMKKNIQQKRSWKGNSQKKLIGTQGNDLIQTGDAAQKRINSALDELNIKLSSLRAERNEKYGLLGEVISALDALKTRVENFINDF